MARIAKRPYQRGDALPAIGSLCEVACSNSDISSDQDRAYSELMVIGYTPEGEFVCFQKSGCWPVVERLTQCWFAEERCHAAV